ncbi:FAD-dependent monooxygenase [Actinomadura scrupuli]|uniref:FAD-dependent monooxygenase n=1 Tax=Actinomadura scrupuli TaxID=559629 RepID=UPI003D961190
MGAARGDGAAEVLVVGAGPSGLTLTLDLARRGVPVRLLERDDGTFPGSRAKGVQPRTLEVFDDLGVLAAAQAAGGAYPPIGLHLGPWTATWRPVTTAEPGPAVPYPNALMLPQYATTAILRRAVEDAGVRIDFGTEVTGIVQDAESASAILADGARLRARYLVGTDGGGSIVRNSAGLAFEGSTNDTDRLIIVDGQIDHLSRDRWHVFPRLNGRVATACPLPDGDDFQIMIKVRRRDPIDLAEPALQNLFAKIVGKRVRLRSVRWASVFRPNVRLVEGYRRGRVLLAGDAAHVHTPAGAQGLNTGIQDGYNLGWKLAQVLAGAPGALLDTYEGERRPIAARVLGRSSELYNGAKRVRPTAFKRGDEERQLALTYADGPLSAGSATTLTLRAGDRAPDGTALDGRIFDLTRGPHFTLLAFGREAATASQQVAWPSRGAALHRHQAHPGNPRSAERLGLDAYGITSDTLILIRPDGYVGHIATRPPSGHLDLTSLTQAIALMTPP